MEYLYIYISQPLHVWKMLQSHIHLCGWPHFSDSVTFSYWAAQNWTEHFRWGLSSAENGWITSLKLLAAFFLMKPRRLVAFFTVQVHFSCSAWGPPGASCPFLQSFFPVSQPPADVDAWGYSSPGTRLFALLNFIRFPSSKFFNLFLWMAQPFGVSAAPHSFVLSAYLTRVNCSITPSINEDIRVSAPVSTPRGQSTNDLPSAVLLVLLVIILLVVQPPTRFSVFLTVHFDSLYLRML